MIKKLLIPHSDSRGPAKGKIFVAPIKYGKSDVRYISVPGNNNVEKAMAVFVGVEVDTVEFMKKLADNGLDITLHHDWQEKIFSEFFSKIKDVKIGGVVRLVPDPEGRVILESDGFTKPDNRKNLP